MNHYGPELINWMYQSCLVLSLMVIITDQN